MYLTPDEILQEYYPVFCNGSWNDTAMMFADNPHVLENMKRLAYEFLRDDGFRKPIVVSEGRHLVLDGTHRVIVASLYEPDVPLEVINERGPNDDYSELEFETEFEGAEVFFDDEDMIVPLISFVVGEDNWCSAMPSTSGNVLTLSVICEKIPLDEADIELVRRKLQELIGKTLRRSYHD